MAVRIFILITMPFLLSLAFVSTFIRGVRSAFYYAYLDVRIEIDDAKKYWRAKSLRKDDLK